MFLLIGKGEIPLNKNKTKQRYSELKNTAKFV